MDIELLEKKDFLNVEEAVVLFKLSRRKLLRLIKEEEIPFIAMYRTRRLIIKDELIKYLEKPGVKEALANGKSRTKKRFEA